MAVIVAGIYQPQPLLIGQREVGGVALSHKLPWGHSSVPIQRLYSVQRGRTYLKTLINPRECA